MMKTILIFLVVSISSLSFARTMGKDRGGGNGEIAEFVQIMDVSIDLLLESSDTPTVEGLRDIGVLKAALKKLDLVPVSGWRDFSYYEKVQIGLEHIFLSLKFDSLKAKTNSLILAVYLEELTTQTLEDVFVCSTLTKMIDSDGSPIFESFTLSLTPSKAREFRDSLGLKKSTIAYVTSEIMGSLKMSFPTDLVVGSPKHYALAVSTKDVVPAEMHFEIVGNEIRGDISVRHRDDSVLIYPLTKCRWL